MKVLGIHEKYILIKKDKSIDLKDTKKGKAKVVIPVIEPKAKNYTKFSHEDSMRKEIELNLDNISKLSGYIDEWDDETRRFLDKQIKAMDEVPSL